MPQRADEIVVHLGHRILVRQTFQLRLEQLLLQIGIVQFRVGVGNFHALNKQLKPFRNRRGCLFAVWSTGKYWRDSR